MENGQFFGPTAYRAQTNGQMDARYQVHYLPRFAVDKYD